MSTTKRVKTGSLPGPEWVRPWMQLGEIAWSAPMVIGYRTSLMLMGGWPPRAQDRREYARMWQEKVSALGRAYLAAMTTPPMDAARLVGKVLTPVHRRVVANRRRLSRM